MTSTAVEEVVGIEQGGSWLRRLAQKGLFVSVSKAAPRIYEFHPLFREFLLGELRRTFRPSERKKLMVQAAKYLADNGGENDAITLYEAAGQPVKAVRVAERASGAKLKNGEEGTLREWVALADKYGLPALQLRVASIDAKWAQSSDGTTDEIRRTLRRFQKKISRIDALGLDAYLAWALTERTLRGPVEKARAILREVGAKDNHRAGRLAHAVLAWANLVCERSLDEAEKDARAALRAARRLGARTSVAQMRNLLVWILLARGKSREAEEIDGRFSFAASGWSGFIDAIEPLDRAFWAHRNLQWNTAIEQSQTGVLNAERLMLNEFVQIGNVVRASILSDIGAAGPALNVLERADMASWKRYPLWGTDVYLTHIQVRRRQGDLEGARSWLERAKSLPQPHRSSLRIRLESILASQSLSPDEATARLVSLVRETRRRIGPVQIEVLAELFIGWNAWRSGLFREGLHCSRSAIRLAHNTGNLAPVCAELAALPKFKAYLQANMRSEEATRSLWDGINQAQSVLKSLVFAEGRAATTRSSELVALGGESISVAGTAVRLKPLFVEVLFFVVDKGRVSRDELLETFWPGRPVSRQRQGSNAAVYAIRKILGRDAVRIQGDMVVCSEALSKGYDAARFESLAKHTVRSGGHRAVVLDEAAQALSWYGGPFLPGHTRQWVIDRRAELDAVFRALVAEYTTTCIAQGRAADAAQLAAKALSYDPLDERSAMLMAKVHLAMGRRAHAHQVVAEFGVAFKRELGLGPSKEFLLFEDSLLHDDAPQDSVPDQTGATLRAGSVRSA